MTPHAEKVSMFTKQISDTRLSLLWIIIKSTLDNLKLELREWALIPQEVLRASCEAFQGGLKSVIKNKGGHIE